MKNKAEELRELGRRMEAIEESIKEMLKQANAIAEKINNPKGEPTSVEMVIHDDLSIYKKTYVFFQEALHKSMVFCGMKYDEMLLDLKHDSDWETKFDFVLVNGDSIVIIEVIEAMFVKNISQDFVQEFAVEKIKRFRELFPEFKNLKAYLGIAAFSFKKNKKIF